MTPLNNNSIKTILQEVLTKDGDSLKQMVKSIMQEGSTKKREQQVRVLSPQRDNKLRGFTSPTPLFENYPRSEKVQLASIYLMVTPDVSTNRVEKMVGKLSSELIYSKPTAKSAWGSFKKED